MIGWYQNLPQKIDPVAFSLGPASIYWYSLMWVLAFVVGYALLIYRIKRNEGGYVKDFIQDITANLLIGALVGGRLGYVAFYDLFYYIHHPIEIISPYNFALGEWTGIFGMSYHGGLIGAFVAIVLTAYRNKKPLLQLCDFIVPVVPIGYMFGRIGNFLNHELVGRVTSSQFGMKFDGYPLMRHPSQLYEAILEGLVLFMVLWSIRNKSFKAGTLSAWYLVGYAVMRFIAEFTREPDAHLGFIIAGFTMGQVLSFLMFFVGLGILLWLNRGKIKAHFTG